MYQISCRYLTNVTQQTSEEFLYFTEDNAEFIFDISYQTISKKFECFRIISKGQQIFVFTHKIIISNDSSRLSHFHNSRFRKITYRFKNVQRFSQEARVSSENWLFNVFHFILMGSLCSAAKQIAVVVGKSLLSQLGLNFSIEEWVSAHNSGTIEENSSELAALGTDLKTCSTLPTNLTKAVFICCNTYTKPSYSLGVGPMNDAITVATYMKEQGFTIYFAHNPTSTQFLTYFKHFLGNTKNYLLVYYTGHGGSIDDTNGDEDDGKDEALVFDDAFVVDDTLAEAISSSDKPASSKVILLNDCCHSGSIYDLQSSSYTGKAIPANIMSLSAARDTETAKQTQVESKDQGIFTFYFFKLLSADPTLTPAKMETQINTYISKFEQQFTKFSTTEALYDQVIFQ